jgi:alkanesulfonate monooxygenase SsuD/methylene tetrahydromethanopterin reductase-like flavin-dependent oxidoreductase (luciferase family)
MFSNKAGKENITEADIDGKFLGRAMEQVEGVSIVGSSEAVAEQCDAVLLESVDGRVHLELFKKVAPYGKLYIDMSYLYYINFKGLI